MRKVYRRSAPPEGRDRTHFHLALLIGGFFVLMLPNLNNSHPYQGDESFYTVAAAEMVARGEYLAPSYFDHFRFNKPILTYWFVAGAYRILGVSMWSGRLPFLIMACLAILFTFRLALLLLEDRRKALLAAALTAATPLFFLYSRLAMTEGVLLFFTVLSVYMLAKMFRFPARARRWALLGTAAAGLGFMAKGPAGLAPLAAAVLYAVFAGGKERRRLLLALVHPLNLAILALIVVPWYAYVLTFHGEMFSRNVSTETGVLWKFLDPVRTFKHLWFYSYILLLYVFPFLPAGLVALYLKRKFPWKASLNFPATHAALVIAAFIVFVAIHKARYLLPVVPFLSLIMAQVLYSRNWTRVLKLAWAVLLVQLALYLAYPVLANHAVRKLTYEWKRSYSALGTVGFLMRDAKDHGWGMLYAGNRGIEPAAQADFLVIEHSYLPGYPDWRILRSEKQNHSLVWEKDGFKVTGILYHLIQRPPAKPSP